jgi:ABC-type sugar transport system substrate-binding protein
MRADLARLVRVAILVVAAALLLSACGGDDSSDSGSSSSGTSSGSASGGGGGESKGTIGFSIPQGADPSLRLLDGGLKAEAAKHGLSLKTVDANLDVNKQLSDIDTFVTQKVKAIVVWPLSSEAVQPALARAQQANIPIIAIYALTDGPYYTDLIIDGKGVGSDAAKYMAQELGQNAKVAAIFGPPQVDQFREVAEGFKAGAKEAGLDLVGSQIDAKIAPEGSADITQSFKSKFGAGLKGLFVSYESGALAAGAVSGDGFNPDIVTYGGTDQSLEGLKNGQFAASVYQNVVLMGRIAGWAAGQAVDGKKIPEKLYISPPVLTQKNVEGYPSTAEQLTKEYDFKPVQEDGRWTMPLFQPEGQ